MTVTNLDGELPDGTSFVMTAGVEVDEDGPPGGRTLVAVLVGVGIGASAGEGEGEPDAPVA
jgi:hypothetical protein